MTLSDILTGARSSDEATRRQAEAALEQASNANLAGYLTALCTELSSPNNPENRMIAGLILKNTLLGKTDQESGLTLRWQLIEVGERRKIRQAVLMVLGSQFPKSRKVA